MRAAIQNLEEDLATIRTGRASPALVEKTSGRILWLTDSIDAVSYDQCP